MLEHEAALIGLDDGLGDLGGLSISRGRRVCDEVANHIRVDRGLGAVLAFGVVGEGDAREGQEVAVVARGPDVGCKLSDELCGLPVVLIHLRALVVCELREGLVRLGKLGIAANRMFALLGDLLLLRLRGTLALHHRAARHG